MEGVRGVGRMGGDAVYQVVDLPSLLRNWRETGRANGEEMHGQATPYLRRPLILQAEVLKQPAAATFQDRPRPGGDTDPPHPPALRVPS